MGKSVLSGLWPELCMALISRWRDMLPTEASTAINMDTGVMR